MYVDCNDIAMHVARARASSLMEYIHVYVESKINNVSNSFYASSYLGYKNKLKVAWSSITIILPLTVQNPTQSIVFVGHFELVQRYGCNLGSTRKLGMDPYVVAQTMMDPNLLSA